MYFMDFIAEAWEEARKNWASTQLPSWNRVIYSIPEIYKDLLAAVEKDNGY